MSITIERAEAFKQEVEEKIEALLDEFAEGDISREHFDMVYERYSRQLTIAESAIDGGQLGNLQQVMNELPTLTLRAAIEGKALGMWIVHNPQLYTIRSFGNYELDDSYFALMMDEIQHCLDIGTKDYTSVYKLYSNMWAIICLLEQTTLVTLFRNEPAAKQVQELERRHNDFESANRNILNQAYPDPDTLVYPVELFVRSS